jgi:hypothetical protein
MRPLTFFGRVPVRVDILARPSFEPARVRMVGSAGPPRGLDGAPVRQAHIVGLFVFGWLDFISGRRRPLLPARSARVGLCESTYMGPAEEHCIQSTTLRHPPSL